MKIKKDKSVNFRLTTEKYEQVKSTGYSWENMVDYFLSTFHETTPEGIKIKTKFLENKNISLNNEIKTNEIIIHELKKKSELKEKNILEMVNNDNINFIKIVIDHYLKVKMNYDNITSFLEDNEELIYLHANKTHINKVDYIKIVSKYYEQNYLE